MFLNKAYYIPKRYIIAEKLLPKYYTDVKNQVKNFFTDFQWLNFTTDKSDNKTCQCIANM